MLVRFSLYQLILLFFFHVAYANSHHPQEFLDSVKGKKDEGKQIYEHFCINCHAKKPLISMGAPKEGDESDWNWRLKQEIPLLIKHTQEGINAMPPRGGCFECSDEQLILAIVEMVPEKHKKGLLNGLLAHKKTSK